jgi:hypothetical protein
LGIYFTIDLANPEKEAACIIQALNLTKAVERNGYAISGGSIHEDSSSSDDVQSKNRWLLNNINLDSSTMPCDDES